ncbi:hypothetical protein CQA49_06695 [Helicobacter sp. MIT 00-7814]|uniref:hypothetical protein n=1 Tax=unclassified Helicobacter TaxID=2593540 RepID=UPI000E1F8E2C|nr:MULTISPECIES: hypothetical protein [unclassified Helicobacter]RDU53331.1 hypothetical protein CQA49_06695 [Helicobacter sp. MIT 00-7814]RDU54152.1 hypothetical protein CQA37_05935 [Helicobacter sp. MIT 99-10781]
MKLKTPITLLCAFLFTANMQAREKVNAWLSYSYENYRYEEPNVMHTKGDMAGFNVAFRYNSDEHRHTLKGSFYSGNLTYYGAVCVVGNANACQNVVNPSKDKYYSIEYLGQWALSIDENPHVWMNGGIGYRFLVNKVDNPNAYKREQSYIYAFLGGSGEYFVTRDMMFYLNLNVRKLIRGYNTSYMTGIGFDKDLDFLQKDGYGAVLEIGAKYRLIYVDFGIEGYVDYWNLKDSDNVLATINGASVGYYTEPKKLYTCFWRESYHRILKISCHKKF